MKTLLASLAVLVLASTGISQVSRAEKQPVSDKSVQTISDDEYRVYEALFDQWFGKENLTLMAVDPSLSACKGAAFVAEFKYTKVPDKNTDEIEASCADLRAGERLDASRFHLKQEVVLVTEDEERSFFAAGVDCEIGWKNYFKKYPRSNGYMRVSRVGFDRERRYAAVYFSYIRACLDGEGHKVLLENVGGRWKVTYSMMTWAS